MHAGFLPNEMAMSLLPLTVLERLVWSWRNRHFTGKGWLLNRLCPRQGERTIQIATGARMVVDLGDHLQRLIYMDILHHDWYPALPALLRPGGAFLDVGANVGYFSLLAADLVKAQGTVIAVEPLPRTQARLLANLALNGFSQVRIEATALGERTGELELSVPPPEQRLDYLVSGLPVLQWKRERVPCTTLDEAWVRWGEPAFDLVKIDVEGSEPALIRGGRRALAQGAARALICEISGVHLAHHGLTPQAFVADLACLGFRHARIGRGRRVEPSPLPALSAARDYNLLFVHERGEYEGSG